jgi:hypothetical protein
MNQDEAQGYNVGTFEYPENLREDPDTQHYVAFYILAREKSEVVRGLAGAVENQEGLRPPELITRGSETDIRRNYRSAGNNLNLTDGKALGMIGNNLGSLAGLAVLLKDGISGISGTRVIAAAATKVVVDKIAEETGEKFKGTAVGKALFESGTTVRLKEVITLHMEEKPSVRYAVNYNTKDLGVLTGAIVQGSATDASKAKEFMGEGFARAIAELIKLPGIIGSSTLADIRELTTATRTNPFRQVMFESVDYRTFNFRYNFFPRSEKESKDVRNIIDLFKRHMHPELSENKFFHIYPSEFEIRYMYKTKENPYLHKISTCALTDMQVDYGGDQFSTFENGAPTQISMTLTFRELEQLDSKRIVRQQF